MRQSIAAVLVSGWLVGAPAAEAQSIRESAAKVQFTATPALAPTATVQPANSRQSNRTGWKIVGGVAGGFVGFLAGGRLGAAIEGDCNCDDPGLRGALIGAPIGAVLGAILGVKLAGG